MRRFLSTLILLLFLSISSGNCSGMIGYYGIDTTEGYSIPPQEWKVLWQEKYMRVFVKELYYENVNIGKAVITFVPVMFYIGGISNDGAPEYRASFLIDVFIIYYAGNWYKSQLPQVVGNASGFDTIIYGPFYIRGVDLTMRNLNPKAAIVDGDISAIHSYRYGHWIAKPDSGYTNNFMFLLDGEFSTDNSYSTWKRDVESVFAELDKEEKGEQLIETINLVLSASGLVASIVCPPVGFTLSVTSTAISVVSIVYNSVDNVYGDPAYRDGWIVMDTERGVDKSTAYWRLKPRGPNANAFYTNYDRWPVWLHIAAVGEYTIKGWSGAPIPFEVTVSPILYAFNRGWSVGGDLIAYPLTFTFTLGRVEVGNTDVAATPTAYLMHDGPRYAGGEYLFHLTGLGEGMEYPANTPKYFIVWGDGTTTVTAGSYVWKRWDEPGDYVVTVFQYARGVKTTVGHPWGNLRKTGWSDKWEGFSGGEGLCTYYEYYYLSDLGRVVNPYTGDTLDTVHINDPCPSDGGGGGGGGPPWDPPATPMGSISITFE